MEIDSELDSLNLWWCCNEKILFKSSGYIACDYKCYSFLDVACIFIDGCSAFL